MKNPRPASNFLGRPAKPVINFIWPNSIWSVEDYVMDQLIASYIGARKQEIIGSLILLRGKQIP